MVARYEHGASPETIDAAVARLARANHGVFTKAEVAALGATHGQIYRRLNAGRWERMFPGVYRIAGSIPTWEQRVSAACLAAGPTAVLSHRSGARVWGLGDDTAEAVELTIPHRRRVALLGVVIHRSRDLPANDRTFRRRIPVTTPARTLIDLAATADAELVETLLDEAIRLRLTSLARIRGALERLARSGRMGTATISALVDARIDGVPESALESRFLRMLARARLSRPTVQHEIRHRGRLIARVDFAYPSVLLAIEIDGYRYHAGRARFERDRARLNALTGLGWRVIHVTWAQLKAEPDEVVRLIAHMLAG